MIFTIFSLQMESITNNFDNIYGIHFCGCLICGLISNYAKMGYRGIYNRSEWSQFVAIVQLQVVNSMRMNNFSVNSVK